MTDAPRPSALHVPALDGVRGIAIAMVLLHHSGWPSPVSSIGWVGVDLFFVLSGYLITGILIDTREASNRARSFYVRRALRIFPLYYAVLVAVFVVAPAIVSIHWPSYRALVPGQIWYWTYLCDWPMAFSHPPIVTILGHFWTLSIEEQFYWIWPLVIWSLSRQAAMRVCGMLIVAASILRIYLVTHVPLVLNPSLVVAFEYLFLPTRVDGLAVGALLALALRGPGGGAAVVRWMRPMAVAGVVAMAAVVARRHTASHDDAWVIMVGYPAIALAFGGVVLYAVMRRSPLLELRPIRALGKYSYGLYVLHQPMIMVARYTFRVPDANVDAGGRFTAIMLPIVFLAAYASYHLFEKHFLRLKRVLAPLEWPAVGSVPAAVGPARGP
jgi:peptidoglycan/LPS O-acetylase OafA/YrhL